SRTWPTRYWAAGSHAVHARFSSTHLATLTGVSGQGERSSLTWADHWASSRGDKSEVSTPSSLTRLGAAFSVSGPFSPSPGERQVVMVLRLRKALPKRA